MTFGFVLHVWTVTGISGVRLNFAVPDVEDCDMCAVQQFGCMVVSVSADIMKVTCLGRCTGQCSFLWWCMHVWVREGHRQTIVASSRSLKKHSGHLLGQKRLGCVS